MYYYKKQTSLEFQEVIRKIKESLGKEGFGVLTEIDVKSKLKEKLGVDYDNYMILGACNPSFAYKALQQEKEIGLFMPCNIIVYQDKKDVFVATILPTFNMNKVNNPELKKLAQEVEIKLKKVIDVI